MIKLFLVCSLLCLSSISLIAQVCGPPTYSCSNTSTANPGTIAPIFISSAPTATTCVGDCVNSVKYDLTLNPTGLNPISRLTDGTSFNVGNSIDQGTCSGGDNDLMGSVDEIYLGEVQGGVVHIRHMSVGLDGSYQVVNTGIAGIHVTCPFGFSQVPGMGARFYYLVNKVQLWQGDITSDSTFTATELVDITAAGKCPGVNWGTFGTPTSGSILSISINDDQFSWLVGPSTQGSADWGFSWSRTRGCSTVNFKTGTAWAFCTSSCISSTTALGTFTGSATCFGSDGSTGKGAHDQQTSGDGQYMFVSFGVSGSWTGGACTGSTFNNQFSVWQIGTRNDEWAYGHSTTGVGAAQYAGHPSNGITNSLADYFAGSNIRNNATLDTFTTFSPVPTYQDAHLSWAHPNGVDDWYWIGATDSQLTAQNSGCASPALCPTYLNNVIFAKNPFAINQTPIQFAHTYSCNPVGSIYAKCTSGVGDANFGSANSIGFVTAKGNYFVWSSSHLLSLGNDNTAQPRTDLFAIRLDGPLTSTVSPGVLFGFTETNTSAGNYPTVSYNMQRYWDSPPLQWPSINTSSGVFNFTALDAALALNKTHGSLENMYTLARTPPWATSNPTDTTCHYQLPAVGGGPGECYAPIDLNTDGSGTDAIWKAWVTAIATHVNNLSYLLTHAHIKYWEIWNEPDASFYWHGTFAQLARMTEDANCIITGRGVIHPNGNGTSVACAATAIDPTAKIVMSSGHANGSTLLTYAQNLLYCNSTGASPSYQLPCPNPLNAAAAAMDIINFHMKPDSAVVDVENKFKSLVTSIHGILQSAELGKPLWNGETSYSDLGFSTPYNDPDMAASLMPRMYLSMMTNGITGSAWYTWDSIKVQNAKVSTSYQQTYNWLNGATLSSACTVSGTVWSCPFTKSSVNYLAIWDTSKVCSSGICPTGNVVVPIQWGFYQDMTTVSTPTTIISNTVAVGIKPSILTVGGSNNNPVYAPTALYTILQ